jgi:PhnB protein
MKMPANLWSLGYFAPHFCKAKPKQTNNNKHMPRVSTYLNFPRSTEVAFSFYRSVFKTDFCAPIARFKDIPPQPGCPPLAEADQNLVMHVELPILGGHVLMGTDAPESMGFTLTPGNNVSINLEPDTRAETEHLFEALSDGGKIEMPLQEMFRGGYFGSLTDRFGIRWMFNCASKT